MRAADRWRCASDMSWHRPTWLVMSKNHLSNHHWRCLYNAVQQAVAYCTCRRSPTVPRYVATKTRRRAGVVIWSELNEPNVAWLTSDDMLAINRHAPSSICSLCLLASYNQLKLQDNKVTLAKHLLLKLMAIVVVSVGGEVRMNDVITPFVQWRRPTRHQQLDEFFHVHVAVLRNTRSSAIADRPPDCFVLSVIVFNFNSTIPWPCTVFHC